jgi:hypothetical protein
MTSVMEQQGVDLEHAIEQLDERIGRQRLEVHEWEEKGKSASKFLAELRAQHTEICADVVLGKASQGAVNKITGQILDLENKLIGIEKIVSLKRSELAELQSALQPLHVQQSERAQARAVEEEGQLTAQRIAKAERALADKVQSEKVFVETVLALRAHTYLSEASRRLAMDASQSLARRNNGFRS